MGPRIEDLPLLLDGTGWTWERAGEALRRAAGLKGSMWIGTDAQDRVWLVKMRGPAKAGRERVFSYLAQSLGISCQSSTFLHLPEGSPPLLHDPGLDRLQLAVGLLELHPPEYCGRSCPLASFDSGFKNPGIDKVELLSQCGLTNALDHLRGDLLAHLCGARELPEKAWTTAHELVLVDNEEAWSFKGISLRQNSWFHWSTNTARIAVDLCRSIVALPAETINRMAALPVGFESEISFRDRVFSVIEAAERFLMETGE